MAHPCPANPARHTVAGGATVVQTAAGAGESGLRYAQVLPISLGQSRAGHDKFRARSHR
ncbi:hypothetical protein FH063_005308 [Azospirillum argentinense]|uniref:Uncharacterized protein n=1 Tax=Azospirillum argentinense TaxID=2970906 RepID=A0A5B0KS63_9PROT|nr:hypothetical protein FH063_005308 [Azospirillum argentinense]